MLGFTPGDEFIIISQNWGLTVDTGLKYTYWYEDARATHTPFSRPYQAHPRPWFHLQGLESLSSVSDNSPQLERRQNILSASWARFNGKGVQYSLYSIRSLGPCVWHHQSEAGFCGIRAALRVSIPFPPPDAFLAPQVCQCIVRLVFSHPLKASLHHSSQTATGRCSRGRQNQDFLAAPAVLALLCQARQLEFAAPTPPHLVAGANGHCQGTVSFRLPLATSGVPSGEAPADPPRACS